MNVPINKRKAIRNLSDEQKLLMISSQQKTLNVGICLILLMNFHLKKFHLIILYIYIYIILHNIISFFFFFFFFFIFFFFFFFFFINIHLFLFILYTLL